MSSPLKPSGEAASEKAASRREALGRGITRLAEVTGWPSAKKRKSGERGEDRPTSGLSREDDLKSGVWNPNLNPDGGEPVEHAPIDGMLASGAPEDVDGDELGAYTELADEISDRIRLVQRACAFARGREEHCQFMLRDMVPRCLAPGLDQRDDLQQEAVDMIGKVIENLEAKHIADKERKELIFSDVETARALVQQELDAAKVNVDAGVDVKKDKGKVLMDTRGTLNDVLNKLADAHDEQQKAIKHDEALKAEQADFEDAFEKHFIPLRDGDFKTKDEAMRHIEKLVPLFQRFGYEDSLICGFKPAAFRPLTARQGFDGVCIVEAEKRFQGHMKTLSEKISGKNPVLKATEEATAKAEVSA